MHLLNLISTAAIAQSFDPKQKNLSHAFEGDIRLTLTRLKVPRQNISTPHIIGATHPIFSNRLATTITLYENVAQLPQRVSECDNRSATTFLPSP